MTLTNTFLRYNLFRLLVTFNIGSITKNFRFVIHLTIHVENFNLYTDKTVIESSESTEITRLLEFNRNKHIKTSVKIKIVIKILVKINRF